MSTYTKEWVITLGFFVLYVLTAHTAVWPLLFGTAEGVQVLGFPLHYFAILILGWLGVTAVAFVWVGVANRLDKEIAAGGRVADEPMPARLAAADGQG